MSSVEDDGTPVRFPALDGYRLGGLLHASRAVSNPRRVALLHAGAGIRASSYGRFAAYLARSGIPVLLYDYRGVGGSRPPKLRGFRASIEDWAEYDCGGAIAWLRRQFPRSEILGIAHSIGSLLVGGAVNAAEQERLVLIGAHTGYFGDYCARYRLPMALMWHVAMPAITRVVGYFPARRLGLGEDLPAGVALRWAQRRSPELVPPVERAKYERTLKLLARCAGLKRPTLLVSISDDAFAGRSGTERLLSAYPGLSPLEHLVFTPADAGIRRLGHFGFFRRRAGTVLWPRLLAELEAQPCRCNAAAR